MSSPRALSCTWPPTGAGRWRAGGRGPPSGGHVALLEAVVDGVQLQLGPLAVLPVRVSGKGI